MKRVRSLETKIINLNQQLEDKVEIIKQNKKKIKQLDVKINSETKATITENVTVTKKCFSTQTVETELKDIGTSPLFTKIHLLGEPTHDVTCMCLCHEGSEGKCEVQLFQYTIDPDVALDSLYYREDYDAWIEEEDINLESNEALEKNKAVVEKLLQLKTSLDDDNYMKEMIKDALHDFVQEKDTKHETTENSDSIRNEETKMIDKG